MKKTNTHRKTRSTILLQKNKKAYFSYIISERYLCGIVLQGHEVKQAKAKKCDFLNSFARVEKNTLYLHSFHISPYAFHTHDPIDPARTRVLLAKKREIYKMKMSCEKKGKTLVPLELLSCGGLVKMVVGVGTGKKLHDKKHSIKTRELEIEAQREAKDVLSMHR